MATWNLLTITGSALALTLAGTCSAASAQVPATSATPGDGALLTLAQLRALYTRPADRMFDFHGMPIRYRDEGAGRVVVLLHGSFGSLESFDPLAARLARRYRVVRFDMPGMGLSGTLPKNGTPSTAYADEILKALLDRLQIDRAAIVGVSSGGNAGFHFAHAHPGMVEALVLANTPADPVVQARIQRSPALAAEFREAARTGLKRREYWRIYLEWLAGDAARVSPAFIDKYYDFNRRAADPNALPFQRPNDPAPTQRALAAVIAPTLLVWGARDLVLPLPAMDTLAGYLTGTQVSQLVQPDVGHYPPLETPDRFGAITESYLEQVLPAQPAPPQG